MRRSASKPACPPPQELLTPDSLRGLLVTHNTAPCKVQGDKFGASTLQATPNLSHNTVFSPHYNCECPGSGRTSYKCCFDGL